MTETHPALDWLGRGLLILVLVLAWWQGSAAIIDQEQDFRVGFGIPLEPNQKLAEERSFIKYVLRNRTTLSAGELEHVSMRFGISSGAIRNANGQRGQTSINANRQGHILVPLVARMGANP